MIRIERRKTRKEALRETGEGFNAESEIPNSRAGEASPPSLEWRCYR